MQSDSVWECVVTGLRHLRYFKSPKKYKTAWMKARGDSDVSKLVPRPHRDTVFEISPPDHRALQDLQDYCPANRELLETP